MTVIISGSGGITDVNGTAAAPAITGTDTDTGVFFGTNTVSLSTGGTERLQVDSSGNLGLGVTPLNAYTGSGFKAYELPKANIYSFDLGSRPIAGFSVNSYLNSSAVAKYIATGYATLYESDQGQHRFYTAPSGTAGNTITFTQAMTLDASGNLGIGSTSPYAVGGSWKMLNVGVGGIQGGSSASQSSLLVQNCYYNGSSWQRATTGATGYIDIGSGVISFSNDSSGSAGTFTPTERARIDSSGNLLVGTTSRFSGSLTGLQINGGDWASAFRCTNAVNGGLASWMQRTASTGEFIAFRYGSDLGIGVGAISTNGTTTTYSTSSDYRLKENIQPMTGALAKVAALKPCTYTWKSDGSSGEGFIAHELAEVVPDAVAGEKDAVNEDGSIKPQGIDTSFLVATLTAAIQEQQQIITQLQADIETLKGKA